MQLDRSSYDQVLTVLRGQYLKSYKLRDVDLKTPTYDDMFAYFFYDGNVPCPAEMEVAGGRLPDILIPSDANSEYAETEGDIRNNESKLLIRDASGDYTIPIDKQKKQRCQDVYNTMIDQRAFLQIRQQKVQNYLSEHKCDLAPVPTRILIRMQSIVKERRLNDELNLYIEKRIEYDDLVLTIASYDRSIARQKYARTEGDVSVMSESKSIEMQHEENVVDMAGADTDHVGFVSQMGTQVLKDVPIDIKKWVTHPVELATYSFALGGTSTNFLDPWSLLTSDPSIRSKLRNYGFLRCDLKIRVALAGTPFHKGKVIVAYIPRGNQVDVFNWYNTFHGATGNTFNKWLSQLEHHYIMDVRENEPLEFEIPFISPEPCFRLYNNDVTVIGSSTDFTDVTNMGVFVIATYNTINSVNATSATPVSAYIYGNLENVKLGCPTSTHLDVLTEGDERIVGPVQKFATYATQVLNALTVVPVIGPFARASSMISGGMAALASIFGWSVPTINTAPSRMKNEPFQNAANIIGYDTGHRITLDPKQEIVVGGDGVCTKEDQMTLAFICSRESLLFQGSYDAGLTPMVPFTSWAVTPRAVQSLSYEGHSLCQPTALGFCAAPFQYWRGDITYRLEFVPSNFHRGKVAIFYEPNIAQFDLVSTGLELNKNYMHIIDLQETQELTFTVKWAFPRNWCKTATDDDAHTSVDSQFVYSSDKYEACNGWVGIMPITDLTSPDGSSVDYNVYVWSDNMYFNEVSQTYLPLVMTEGEDDTVCVLNETGADISTICASTFGELPVSFRGLLRRYATTDRTTLVSGPFSNTGFEYVGLIVPPLTVNTGSGSGATYITLLNYLRYAYVAMRGGFKKRVRIIGAQQSIGETTHVSLSPPAAKVATSLNSYTFGSSPEFGYSFLDGTVEFVPSTNGGIEFEIPYYSTNLFYCASNANNLTPSGDSAFSSTTMFNYIVDWDSGAGLEVVNCLEETACAEDFSLLRFLAAPFFTI